MIICLSIANSCVDAEKDVKIDIDNQKPAEKPVKTKRPLQKWKSFPNSGSNSFKSKKWTKDMYSDILQIDGKPLPKLPEEEEAVGIITMEDVIEELLQVLAIIFFMGTGTGKLFHVFSYNSEIVTQSLISTFSCCRKRSLMRQITILRIHDSLFTLPICFATKEALKFFYSSSRPEQIIPYTIFVCRTVESIDWEM